MFFIYLQKFIKKRVRLVSSTIISVLLGFVSSYFLQPDTQFIVVLMFFCLCLVVVFYLVRADEYRKIQQYLSRYNLPKRQEELLLYIREKLPTTLKNLQEKTFMMDGTEDKVLIEDLKDLENEGYIKNKWASSHLFNVEITLLGKKYLDRRL